MRAVAQREMGLFTVPLAMPFYAFKSQMPCDESKECRIPKPFILGGATTAIFVMLAKIDKKGGIFTILRCSVISESGRIPQKIDLVLLQASSSID